MRGSGQTRRRRGGQVSCWLCSKTPHPSLQQYDGALFLVTEVYSRQDESSIKRKKVHHNHGFATAVLVEKKPVNTKNKVNKVEKDDNENKKSNTKTNNNATD